MEQNSLRKYNSEFRKKLLSKFDKLKSKDHLIEIFKIIHKDIGNNFSTNRNGIFINMNLLSDECIFELLNFINNFNNAQTDSEKINYKVYKFDEVEVLSEMGHKLSTQEKNIIKRIRNKIDI